MTSTINVPNYVPVQYRQAVANASAKWNVPAEYIAAVIETESGWNPNAGDNVDSYNSFGLGQFIPSTAASLGVNTHDPFSSIDGVGHLLHDNYQATGNWNDAIAAYNTGLGGIVNGQPTGNGPHYLQVVLGYVKNGVQAVKGSSPTTTDQSATAATAGLNLNPFDGFGIPDAIMKAVVKVLQYALDGAMIGAGIGSIGLGLYLIFKETR